jgi:hypothetical protein
MRNRRPGSSSLLLITLLALVPACSSSTPKSSPGLTAAPTPALQTDTLVCADFVGTDAPSGRQPAVLGAVALASSSVALQTSTTGEAGATRLFAKSALLVYVGEASTITVTDPVHQAIAWGKPGTTTKRLIIPSCPATGSGTKNATWLAYAGGYFVDQPRCAALIVSHDGREQMVKVGVGLACPVS